MSEKIEQTSHGKIVESMNDCLRNVGRLHMYLSRPVADKYGKKGEIIIREGIRSLGTFRGEQIKKWHLSERLPLTMENLMRFWDAASVYTIQEDLETEGTYTPYYVTFPVRTCVAQEEWAKEGYEDRGYWYCDEGHFAICQAYNKDAIVEIHENLNKGDKFCGFYWMQKPGGPVDTSAAEALTRRMTEQKEEFALECLKRTIRVVGMFYIFPAKSIVKHLGDDGRQILKESVTALGRKRGEILKEVLKTTGYPTNVENIFKVFDLPYSLLWKIKATQSNSKYTATVDYCPLAELWDEAGNGDLGSIWCNNIYESIFKVFNSSAEIEIPECRMAGDKNCRFVFKL